MTPKRRLPASRRVRRTALGVILCALALSIAGPRSEAAGVSIEGDLATSDLTVRIDDARVEDVLARLSQRFGFELAGKTQPAGGAAWSATMTGDLQAILARLLRNRNHAIIRSSSAAGGVRRVVLIDGKAGSKPVSTAKATAKASRRRLAKSAARAKRGRPQRSRD